MTDLELISSAAIQGGALALSLLDKGLSIEKKADATPVSNADLAVDAFLRAALTQARPGYGWLSEESAASEGRLNARRLFIVDPIDGTSAYISGKPWWAVCIAVVEDGLPVAAVVHAPALHERYLAAAGAGATLNDVPVRASEAQALADCRMLGDAGMFAHPGWRDPWPTMMIETRNAIAYRVALVAAGAFDATVALSAKSEWDLAAAALIAAEGGALITDHKGAPLKFNTARAKIPSVICAAPGVYPLILARTSRIELPS